MCPYFKKKQNIFFLYRIMDHFSANRILLYLRPLLFSVELVSTTPKCMKGLSKWWPNRKWPWTVWVTMLQPHVRTQKILRRPMSQMLKPIPFIGMSLCVRQILIFSQSGNFSMSEYIFFCEWILRKVHVCI